MARNAEGWCRSAPSADALVSQAVRLAASISLRSMVEIPIQLPGSNEAASPIVTWPDLCGYNTLSRWGLGEFCKPDSAKTKDIRNLLPSPASVCKHSNSLKVHHSCI